MLCARYASSFAQAPMLQLAKLGCCLQQLKMARKRSLRTSWVTMVTMRHYGDVREPVISDAQIRIVNETSIFHTTIKKQLFRFFLYSTNNLNSFREIYINP